MRALRVFLRVFVFALLAAALPALGANPELYSQPLLQSPVRGNPDDLLLVAGHGFDPNVLVVYRERGNGAVNPPSQVPSQPTAEIGVAPTVWVPAGGINVTVYLPDVMTPEGSYVLWFQNPGESQWAGPLFLNDARPLWFTPPYAYRNDTIPGLSRTLKVVGRNLHPVPGQTTRVRLDGPKNYTLDAADDQDPSTAIERYVAAVTLPAGIKAGSYTVEVDRGDGHWVALGGQTLTVYDDPAAPTQHDVSSATYGGCSGADSNDDTACVLSAIAAAADGDEIYFPPGSWTFDDYALVDADNGIVLDEGLSLRGAGTANTTLVRTANWNDATNRPAQLFILMGRNTVRDIHFDDLLDPSEREFTLLLGEEISFIVPDPSTVVEDIVIADNLFTNMHIAVKDGGYRTRRVFLVGNRFEAWREPFQLAGNSNKPEVRFNNEDAIVVGNDFQAGLYNDPSISQGSIASQIGGSTRMDYSDNLIDGRVNGGWRAGSFFHMHHSHEMLLYSDNTGYCSGSKAGDGEFVALDNNQNETAFGSKRAVDGATSDQVTVTGTWYGGVPGDEIDYYSEHWVEIVEGKGLGQARQIGQIEELGGGQIRFTVSPPWDVVPDTGSYVTVDRTYWQAYIVDNCVDNTDELPLDPLEQPCGAPVTCPPKPDEPFAGGDPTPKKKWGRIFAASLTVDSAIESNEQYNADGISAGAIYAIDVPGTLTAENSHTYFLEIRGNRVDHELDFSTPNESARLDSLSGINIRQGAYLTAESPTINYGISIAHNTIVEADGLRGGAIGVSRPWYKPINDVMTEGTLIFHNDIREIRRLEMGVCPTGGIPVKKIAGIGVHLHEGYVHDTVLYDNKFFDTCYEVVNCGMSSGEWINGAYSSLVEEPDCP